MKNNDNHQIRQARNHRQGRAVAVEYAHTDIIVIPRVVEDNMRRIAAQPARRKRRINYMKKIMNDPSILNA